MAGRVLLAAALAMAALAMAALVKRPAQHPTAP
jgi:hypothetical protein